MLILRIVLDVPRKRERERKYVENRRRYKHTAHTYGVEIPSTNLPIYFFPSSSVARA